jgi:hypothetical protein
MSCYAGYFMALSDPRLRGGRLLVRRCVPTKAQREPKVGVRFLSTTNIKMGRNKGLIAVRESSQPTLAWRIGLALVVVACVMIIFAASLAVETWQFLADARTSPGRVISLEQSASGRTSIYYPIVQFRTAEGQMVTFRSSLANVAALRQAVPVLYLPTSPRDARIDSYKSLWFWPTLLAGLAVVFLLVGGRLLAVAGKEQKSQV